MPITVARWMAPYRYLKWQARAYCNKADRRRWKRRYPSLTFSYMLTTDPLSAQPRRYALAETNIPR